jgi:uncharacterized membrane protein
VENLGEENTMATLHESIEVEVPVTTAYNQWTQFETFPKFMSGVDSVEQLDETSLRFRTDIAGVKREYNAKISEQLPDRRITWVSTDKPRNSGTVTFEPLDGQRTRVNVEVYWEPEGLAEKAGSALGVDSRQVSADLKRFKEFIESRGIETGAWRSTVEQGEVDDPPFETAASGIPSSAPAVFPSAVPSPERPAGTDPIIDDDEPVDPR